MKEIKPRLIPRHYIKKLLILKNKSNYDSESIFIYSFFILLMILLFYKYNEK